MADKKNSEADNPLASNGADRQKMPAIRTAFVKAMGIQSKDMNPNPIGGYKLEHNYTKRQAYLAEAMRLRDAYAEMVKKTGIGQGILDKMDSNLENRDLRVAWR